MQNPFKMLGDMNAMRKSAMEIQAALEKEEFEVESGNVRVVISGNQVVKTVEVDGEPHDNVKRAINDAIKKSQQAAASKLAQMTQGMQ
jgi:DNA-binding protein YbaB